MKQFIFLALLSFLLISCSEKEIITPEDNRLNAKLVSPDTQSTLYDFDNTFPLIGSYSVATGLQGDAAKLVEQDYIQSSDFIGRPIINLSFFARSEGAGRMYLEASYDGGITWEEEEEICCTPDWNYYDYDYLRSADHYRFVNYGDYDGGFGGSVIVDNIAETCREKVQL